MTNQQKEQIRTMRLQGIGYIKIGKALGISDNTVRSFCRRNGLGDKSKNAAVCKQCGRSLVQRKYIRVPVFWCVTTAERTIVARSQKQAQPGCAEHSIHLVKQPARLSRYRSLPYRKSLLMSWVRIILRTSGFATEFSIFVSAMIML